jgi:MFS family permease
MSVIYAFFTVAAYFTVPDDAEQHKGGFNVETFKKFDFLGAFLAISGIALFTAALTLAGNAPDGWRTGYVIAFLIVGAVLLVAFVYWQSVFKYPLMPLSVWKDRNFTLLVTTLCLGFYGFGANGFWITADSYDGTQSFLSIHLSGGRHALVPETCLHNLYRSSDCSSTSSQQ